MKLVGRISAVVIVLWSLTATALVVMIDMEVYGVQVFELFDAVLGTSIPLFALAIMLDVIKYVGNRRVKYLETYIKELQAHITLAHNLIDKQNKSTRDKAEIVEETCKIHREAKEKAVRAARIINSLELGRKDSDEN